MTQATAADVESRVNDLLRWGVVFSIVWLMGVGSLIAVICGVRAKHLIQQSGLTVGKGRVQWCVVVGVLGLLVWVPMVVIGVINNLGR